ncbi:hypothetical protein BDR05DRAFT_569300 [Suillus weaverae]|nr:hypothetical protein BDR05DRAFT_569300 [Suillus weaverae]
MKRTAQPLSWCRVIPAGCITRWHLDIPTTFKARLWTAHTLPLIFDVRLALGQLHNDTEDDLIRDEDYVPHPSNSQPLATGQLGPSALDFRHRTTPHHIHVHDQRGGRREPSTVQLVSHSVVGDPGGRSRAAAA